MPSIPQPTTTHQDQVYGVIYVVTNKANRKQYVGQTTQPVEERWAKHVSEAIHRRRNRCTALANAICKYGPNAFDVEAVIACDNKEELDRFEAMAIEAGGTLAPNGYNLKTGGSNGLHGVETRAKIGAANKRRPPPSPETRAKISAANRGKTLSPEHRVKLSEAQRRRFADPEERAKTSEAMMGNQNRKRKP